MPVTKPQVDGETLSSVSQYGVWMPAGPPRSKSNTSPRLSNPSL